MPTGDLNASDLNGDLNATVWVASVSNPDQFVRRKILIRDTARRCALFSLLFMEICGVILALVAELEPFS